jgi:two-component system sensor histidine kinase KdpD
VYTLLANEMMASATVRSGARQVGLGGLSIAVVTLICYPLHLDLTIAALVYLLTVVLQSQAGGFAASAIVSVVAVLCLDFFFTQPLLKLEIASPLDAVALATYLLTSLIITRLASDSRQKARTAERKQQAFARLYETAWRLFSVEPQAVSERGTLQIFREVLELEGVCLFDVNTGELDIAGDPSRSLAERTRNAFDLGSDYEDPLSRISIRCLHVGGRRIGAIGFQGLTDSESMAAPLSMLAGATLERAMQFQSASAAAAMSQAEMLRTAIVDAFAHQFKTPLAAILTAAGGIRETRPLTPQQLEMSEIIEVETVRLSKLTTRLLRTARLDRSQVQPILAPTNLAELIARAADHYPSERHSVFLDLEEAPVEVAADGELLTLVLTQLLDNAFKYSAPGSVVTIKLESKGGVACLRVKNQGSIIAPGERERIFERFYRGAAASHANNGAGLGLYVARKIAQAHIGSLELEEYGSGGEETVFCLKLPILEAYHQHARQAS